MTDLRERLAIGDLVKDEARNATYTILARSDADPEEPLYASGASGLVYRAESSEGGSVVLLKEVYPTYQPAYHPQWRFFVCSG